MCERYVGKTKCFRRLLRRQHGTAIPIFCSSAAIGFVAALALNGPATHKEEANLSFHVMKQHFYATPVHALSPIMDTAFLYVSSQENDCRTDVRDNVSRKLTMDDGLQESLAAHIRKTYRISLDTAERIVRTSVELSQKYDADPFLLLGIIAKESSFDTKAKSSYGAAGLMQVYAPSHKKILGELGVNMKNRKAIEKILLSELDLNMTAGTRIFKQYERQYGTVEKALQAYNGARTDSTFKYARKVLALRDSFYGYLSAQIQTGDLNDTLNLVADNLMLQGTHLSSLRPLALQ